MPAWSFYTNRSGLSCKYRITYWPYPDEAFTMPAIDTHWIMSISAFRFATSWGWGQTAWPCLINSSPSYLPPDSRSTENNRIITNTEHSMHCRVAKLRNRRLQTIAIFSTWERLHRDKLNAFYVRNPNLFVGSFCICKFPALVYLPIGMSLFMDI